MRQRQQAAGSRRRGRDTVKERRFEKGRGNEIASVDSVEKGERNRGRGKRKIRRRQNVHGHPGRKRDGRGTRREELKPWREQKKGCDDGGDGGKMDDSEGGQYKKENSVVGGMRRRRRTTETRSNGHELMERKDRNETLCRGWEKWRGESDSEQRGWKKRGRDGGRNLGECRVTRLNN